VGAIDKTRNQGHGIRRLGQTTYTFMIGDNRNARDWANEPMITDGNRAMAHIDDSTKGTKFKKCPTSTSNMFDAQFSRWHEAFDESALCYALCADCHGRETKPKCQHHLKKLPEELIQLSTKATPCQPLYMVAKVNEAIRRSQGPT
jgi:hypothetical protein